MDAAEVRAATLELLGSSDEADVAYIDDDLLAEYEDAEEATEPAGDDDHPDDAPQVAELMRVYYGNHLAYGTPRGRLYFSNGSPNRPNDPCGRRNRWYVQMTTGSQINPFRNCSGFTGYQIVVY
jgi:hypothetical protein